MTPTIDEIITGLLNSTYTSDQAKTLIDQHITEQVDLEKLKDSIACQAMQALITKFGVLKTDWQNPQLAKDAYLIAEAMLAEKAK